MKQPDRDAELDEILKRIREGAEQELGIDGNSIEFLTPEEAAIRLQRRRGDAS